MVSLSRGGCCRSSCSCHHAEEALGSSECVLSEAAEPAWDSTHSSAGGWRARMWVGGSSGQHAQLRSGREVHATCGTCGACGVNTTRGTCARRAAERAACMPHVARAPGKGAERAVCLPRVAHAPGGRRSVQRACHAWHMRQGGRRRVRWAPPSPSNSSTSVASTKVRPGIRTWLLSGFLVEIKTDHNLTRPCTPIFNRPRIIQTTRGIDNPKPNPNPRPPLGPRVAHSATAAAPAGKKDRPHVERSPCALLLPRVALGRPRFLQRDACAKTDHNAGHALRSVRCRL